MFTTAFTLLLSALAPVAASEGYLLKNATESEPTQVTVSLELGGDLLVPGVGAEGPTGTTKVLPLSVSGKFKYGELLLEDGAKSEDESRIRSLRVYEQAEATMKTDEQGVERVLPKDLRTVVCEQCEGRVRMQSTAGPLTREQIDLLDVVGNTLVLDRLLPGKKIEEGELWEHTAEEIAGIFGLDNAGVCEISSIVIGEENGQVQIRMAGTVHGGIDGASTEMEIKGAYLYHTQQRRITKMNLVVKEKRKASDVSPGLDVTAKLSIAVRPAESEEAFSDELVAQARELEIEPLGQLLFDSPQRGYRFAHTGNWFVTADRRELVSMRLLNDGTLLAHCNVTTLPPRSAERETTLEQFQREVQQSLGNNVQEIAAANEWTSPNGHKCMAVFANGKVKDIAVQWRYYLVSAPDVKRVSVAATVEQAKLDQFADADRLIVDSMELVGAAAEETAGK